MAQPYQTIFGRTSVTIYHASHFTTSSLGTSTSRMMHYCADINYTICPKLGHALAEAM